LEETVEKKKQRFRRTAEEIAANFPQVLKAKGVNFKEWLEKQENLPVETETETVENFPAKVEKEELQTWEWQYLEVDNKFKLNMLEKVGKDGWKFAFVLETAFSSKKNPVLCFQRASKKIWRRKI
jgi:hypothetical protein